MDQLDIPPHPPITASGSRILITEPWLTRSATGRMRRPGSPGRPDGGRMAHEPEPLTAARFTLSAEGEPITGVVRISALELSGGGIGVTVAPVTITRLAGSDDLFHAWAHDALGR